MGAPHWAHGFCLGKSPKAEIGMLRSLCFLACLYVFLACLCSVRAPPVTLVPHGDMIFPESSRIFPSTLCLLGTKLSLEANQLYRVFAEKYPAEFRDVSSPGLREPELKIRIWPQHRPAIATIEVRKVRACDHACPGEGWFTKETIVIAGMAYRRGSVLPGRAASRDHEGPLSGERRPPPEARAVSPRVPCCGPDGKFTTAALTAPHIGLH